MPAPDPARRRLIAELFAATLQRPSPIERAVTLSKARRAVAGVPYWWFPQWYAAANFRDDPVAAAAFIAVADTGLWAHAAWHYPRRHPSKTGLVAAYLALDGRKPPTSVWVTVTYRDFHQIYLREDYARWKARSGL